MWHFEQAAHNLYLTMMKKTIYQYWHLDLQHFQYYSFFLFFVWWGYILHSFSIFLFFLFFLFIPSFHFFIILFLFHLKIIGRLTIIYNMWFLRYNIQLPWDPINYRTLTQSLKRSHSPATAHPICFVPTARMSLPPIWVKFHQSMHVSPPGVVVPTALPSPICATLVPFGVAPLSLATPSLFPSSYVFLSTFLWSSCGIVASSPLFPMMLYP